MTWERLVLCFELLSPFHIGFLPNRPGTVVARTRPYVPGKNLWGAVTARLTPRVWSAPTAADYRRVGESLKRQVVFSYLCVSDGTSLFTPDYGTNGLSWGGLSDRDFRARFISSQVSTAIEKRSGGAKDNSLHEIEFVRHRVGSPGKPSERVLLVGMVWLRQGGDGDLELSQHGSSVVVNESDIFESILVGGERNYGFGRLQRVTAPKVLAAAVETLWPWPDPATATWESGGPLPAHAPYQPDRTFRGEIEIIAGREYGHRETAVFQRPGTEIASEGHFFAPGTRIGGDATRVRLDPFGRLMWLPNT